MTLYHHHYHHITSPHFLKHRTVQACQSCVLRKAAYKPCYMGVCVCLRCVFLSTCFFPYTMERKTLFSSSLHTRERMLLLRLLSNELNPHVQQGVYYATSVPHQPALKKTTQNRESWHNLCHFGSLSLETKMILIKWVGWLNLRIRALIWL